MAKLIQGEAAAYLRFGLLTPQRRKINRETTASSPVGILFVPGLGANGSQFLPLRARLEREAGWFGAFEYPSLGDPARLAARLLDHLRALPPEAERVLVVGHSLGGLIAALALEADGLPERVAGLGTICSPLNGTWTSKLGLTPGLRKLRPDGALIQGLQRRLPRLHERFPGRLLTVCATHDHFIRPPESALLPGSEQLTLKEAGHVASLLAPATQDTLQRLVRRIAATTQTRAPGTARGLGTFESAAPVTGSE